MLEEDNKLLTGCKQHCMPKELGTYNTNMTMYDRLHGEENTTVCGSFCHFSLILSYPL